VTTIPGGRLQFFWQAQNATGHGGGGSNLFESKRRMREGDQDTADVARVLAGDAAAFEGIVLRWQRRLVNLAWRFCREQAMAEDMAQEVFLKAFRSLGKFRGESAFSTWLTAIAVNTYRSRLHAEGQPLASLDAARVASSEASPLRGVMERQRAESVRRAVLALPRRYREAILLFYFEDKSVPDAARTLGVAEGTLKARLHRGRDLLRHKCGALESPAAEATAEEL
jgi:RNA polymerase sigma-70 factor (ECF subfamily)